MRQPFTDAEHLELPDLQRHPEDFPLALAPGDSSKSPPDTLQWLRENRQGLLEALALHGAILFRGFKVQNAEEFDQFIAAFELDSFTYAESLSNAVRVNVTDRVFTANEAPRDVEIFLHHEMAQTPLFPSRLFFFCEDAAEEGGATPICRSDVLLQQLTAEAPDFVRQCEELGVRYANVMPGSDDAQSGQGRSWRSTLGVDTREQAEERLQSLGYEFLWLEDDALRVTTAPLPAIRTLMDGRRVFFNQLIAAFKGWKDSRNTPEKSVCFGDGTTMDRKSLETAARLADGLSYDLFWEPGDVALIDNFLVMHGRRPFGGSRRVLASLVADSGDRLTQNS